jgi:5-methylcytosine-specific restriction enzyme A
MKKNREHQHLYNLAIWRGPNGVRAMKLRHDPMCEVTGCTRPATTVDHRRAHKGDYFLFCGGIDFANLRSLCKPHHDEKKKAFEDGKKEFNPVSATGSKGSQYVSSTIDDSRLDKALGTPDELAELLKDIPQ